MRGIVTVLVAHSRWLCVNRLWRQKTETETLILISNVGDLGRAEEIKEREEIDITGWFIFNDAFEGFSPTTGHV